MADEKKIIIIIRRERERERERERGGVRHVSSRSNRAPVECRPL